jgi:hypothetical protein
MTEEEWFATSDARAMLRLWNARRVRKVSRRKLQHFAQAVATSIPELLAIPAAVELLRLGEQAAESGEPPAIADAERERILGQIGVGWASMLCRHLLAISDPKQWGRPEDHADMAAGYARRQIGEDATCDHAQILRDIVGNPFRPVTLDPAWRTATVTSLAQAIYEERAFDRMPILADALEDAGCTEVALLQHCRSGAAHVRGCWAIDAVLEKG